MVLHASRYPGGDHYDRHDRPFTDNAVDANYQWHADPDNIVSVHSTFIHEDENLNASSPLAKQRIQPAEHFPGGCELQLRKHMDALDPVFHYDGTRDHEWLVGNFHRPASPDSSGFITEIGLCSLWQTRIRRCRGSMADWRCNMSPTPSSTAPQAMRCRQ